MNLLDLLNDIETQDPADLDKPGGRRDMFKQLSGVAGKIALTALPLGLSGLFEKAEAAGPSTPTVLSILNYALTLEYLESSFYHQGLAVSTLIPTGIEYDAIDTIYTHEKEHVAFLQSTIKSLGGTPVSEPTFDYTGGGGSGNGPFAGVFSDYSTFLAVAQAFEDTGVRAYKGQAGALAQGGAYLTAALDIHSVEARHASMIRQMRNQRQFADVTPWITLNYSGIGASVDATYYAEQNTLQAGIQIVGINGYDIGYDAASAAFDETLTKEQVLAIVTPFIVAS
jgi:Ferritin-like domain